MTSTAAPSGYFLDVERSALGRPWRDRLDPSGSSLAQALAQTHGLGDLLARVLAARGVAIGEAERYLRPRIRDLMPDPDALRDMGAATARLADAVRRGETVAIFGDYDVDGACAAALVADYLERAGAKTLVHIPDRIFEGYGPNPDAVTRLAGEGARLLVTVDCGTTSHATLDHAAALGLDVVVIDHHQAPESLPKAVAIVNPNRQDDLSGLGYLCAAGVAFMTLVALNRRLREAGWWSAARPEPKLFDSLDLVALATVADVVPLTGLNRAFVRQGLEVMRGRGRPGLAALFDVARAGGPPRADHLGFLIGPRINAGGRIGDAALGARLLRLGDPVEAARIAAELDRLNRERRAIEVAAVAEAEQEAVAALGDAAGGAAVVVASERWHPGVLGLVAARLKEKLRRPVFAVSFTGDVGTGSGRSIAGVDLGRAVRRAVDEGLLVKGGGHAMAAGITLRREALGAFRAFLDEALGAEVAAAAARDGLAIDAAVTARGASVEMLEALAEAGPFGSASPEPVFALPHHRIVDLGEAGEGHLRLTLAAADGARIGAMAFRAGGQPLGRFLSEHRDEPLHFAGALEIDRFRGEARARLRLLDAARPAPR